MFRMIITITSIICLNSVNSLALYFRRGVFTVRGITVLYTYCFTLLITMNNQICITSMKHYAKTIFEISRKCLTFCSIYAIKVLIFMQIIVKIYAWKFYPLFICFEVLTEVKFVVWNFLLSHHALWEMNGNIFGGPPAAIFSHKH